MSASGSRAHEVNIRLGDQMSEMFFEASRQTYANRPDCLDLRANTFEGTVLVRGAYFAKHIRDLSFGHELDGIGTKPEVAERLNDHSDSAQDLFAMAGDDVVVRGGEIITIDTTLDVNELKEDDETTLKAMAQLSKGMIRAAWLSRAVVLTGEIAELGRRVGGYGVFNYNWSAAAWYAVHKERAFTGLELRAGHTLVGLAEPGFRSNGITDVRNAMQEAYGDKWHTQVVPELGRISLGRLVQRPSTIYSRFVTELTGGFDIEKEPKAEITGVAHITGGGQPSKLGRMLKRSGLGATTTEPIPPPPIMTHVQGLSGFSDRQAYGKWHMGPGMILATSEPDKVLDLAPEFGIEAKKIGLVDDKPGIRTRNMGANRDPEWLEFDIPA
jgi:phosphoribosylformylglycinamidine cyclo-ligase